MPIIDWDEKMFDNDEGGERSEENFAQMQNNPHRESVFRGKKKDNGEASVESLNIADLFQER